MAGIKETKEALVGVNEVAIFLVSRLKDGVQVGDFTAMFDKLTQDTVFKAKMEAAYNGVALVPSEISDLDVNETVELSLTQLQYVPLIVAALKG